MKQVYVRGHYRRRKKQRRQRNTVWIYLLLIVVLIIILPKLLMAIPLFVYIIFFGLLFGVVALLVVYRLYQIWQAREVHELSQSVYQQPLGQRMQVQAPHVKTLGEVLTLTPPEFEELVGVLLRARGYSDVQRVGGSGDLGVGLLCRDPEGRRVMVQCKRHAPGRAIGTPDLQRFIGMMVTQHYAERGIFVTTSVFRQTIDDIELVRTGKVMLIDGKALVNWIHMMS